VAFERVLSQATKPRRFTCTTWPFYNIAGPVINGRPTTLAFFQGTPDTKNT
jgi:hypothetical protein